VGCASRVAGRDGVRHLHRREVLRVRREPLTPGPVFGNNP
jgi:hypothetical protein